MRKKLLAVAAVLVLAPLTGCIGGTEDLDPTDPENEAPEAKMTIQPETAWTGDDVTFDGRNSTDEDGQVDTWIYALGDGTQQEAEKRSNARFDHAYDEGGVYEVSLTVLDNGGNQTGAKSDTTTQQVVVNQRVTVPPQSQIAGPGGDGNASEYQQQFPVKQHADHAEANLTLQGQLPAGSSQVDIDILDPSDTSVANRTVTLNASEQRSVELSGQLDNEGQHTLRVVTESGSVSFEGEMAIFYQEPGEDVLDG